MGTTHSIQTYIELKSPSFEAGDLISGIANINIEAPTDAKTLTIRLSGKELTRWVRYKQHGKSGSSEVVKGKHQIVDAYYTIWNFGGAISQGQYCIPFRIETPGWLPPSFKYKGFFKKASLTYTLSALVDDKKKTKAIKNYVWANSMVKQTFDPKAISEQASLIIHNFIFFKAAEANIQAKLNTNFAMPSDTISIFVSLGNSTHKYRATKITCRLVRHIHMRVTKGLYKGATKYIKDNLISTTEPISPSSGTSDNTQTTTISLNLEKVKNLWKYPTVNSLALECNYFVDVIVKFNNWLGGKTHKVLLPIEIYNGKVKATSYIVPPPKMNFEWNPVVISNAAVRTKTNVVPPSGYLKETEMIEMPDSTVLINTTSSFLY